MEEYFKKCITLLEGLEYNRFIDFISKQSFSWNIYGAISHTDLWNKKHDISKHTKCIKQELKKGCEGVNTKIYSQVEIQGKPKTYFLQQYLIKDERQHVCFRSPFTFLWLSKFG